MTKKSIFKSCITAFLILTLLLTSCFSIVRANISTNSSEDYKFIKNMYAHTLSKGEVAQITKEINLLSNCGIEQNDIHGIDKRDENYVYEIAIPDSEDNGTVSVKTLKNGDVHYIFKEGSLCDNVIYTHDGKVLLDGKEVVVEHEEKLFYEKEDANLRAIYTHASTTCPYGKAADYNVSAGTINNDNIKLNKRLGSITTNGLASILLKVLKAALILKISVKLAVFIINNGKIDNPDSKALSHKTKRYYHKNGKYVKPGMRVMKNVAQWYTKANYKGTSHKKVTYSIYEQA